MSTTNPYEYHGAAEEEPIQGSEYELASGSRRLVNLVLDGLGISTLSFLLGFLVAAAGFTEVVVRMDGFSFGVLMTFMYYVPCETWAGRTPAKFVTGTRVVAKDGSSATFAQVVGRTFTRFVPFETLTFIAGERPVGWHDSWSNTRVVRIP